jgi:hypothetical protein
MGVDTYTELNLGSGGSFMDETLVTYLVEPLERRRERIHLAGCLAEQLSEVLNTEPSTTDYGLVVRNIPSGKQTVALELPGEEVSVCDIATLVPSNTETTVVSYTIPVGKTFHGVGWTASGDVDAIYRFKINGVLKMVARSSVAWPTIQMEFFLATPKGTAGQLVVVTAEHFGINTATGVGIFAEFDATILGYLV